MVRQKFRVISLSDRHCQINLSDRIAVITQALTRKGKNGRKARLVSAYFGFDTFNDCQIFIAGLKRYFPKFYSEVRKGQRVGTAFEVKLRDFNGLERFVKALIEPAIATSNVVSFVDRSIAPLASRSRGMTATVGSRVISIE
jgi:hypothetical protein